MILGYDILLKKHKRIVILLKSEFARIEIILWIFKLVVFFLILLQRLHKYFIMF